MKRLYVLFDRKCDLCRECCAWLGRQPAFIELQFIPLQSPNLGRRFPGVEKLDLNKELAVISDEGAVYQGPQAWIMCLFALREYRAWSERLAHPLLMPFARRVCESVSKNRRVLSRLFFRASAEELSRELQAMPPPLCGGGDCHYGE